MCQVSDKHLFLKALTHSNQDKRGADSRSVALKPVSFLPSILTVDNFLKLAHQRDMFGD